MNTVKIRLGILVFVCVSVAFSFVALAQDPFSLPDFKLPWSSDLNGKIHITSGPHAYPMGFQFKAKYPVGTGSGLDFAGDKDNKNFEVLAMTAGIVDEIKSDLDGEFGNQVAIRHEGDSVLIYGHLSEVNPELHDGQFVEQGDYLGKAGNSLPNTLSAENMGIHLHIELRNGKECKFPSIDGIDYCDEEIGVFGSPIGWDIGIPIEDYRFFGYYETDVDGVRTYGYNYDGTMVLGDWKVFHGFPYIDTGGIERRVFAYVGVDFECDPLLPAKTCEDSSIDPNTMFANVGVESVDRGGVYPEPGSGLTIYSSNSEQPSPEPEIGIGHYLLNSSSNLVEVSVEWKNADETYHIVEFGDGEFEWVYGSYGNEVLNHTYPLGTGSYSISMTIFLNDGKMFSNSSHIKLD